VTEVKVDDEQPIPDLDTLFKRVERSPFGDDLPQGTLTTEASDFPLVAAGATEDQLLPVGIQGYVAGGSYNDRFIAGPPDGDASTISDTENKLPGWRFVDGSTNGAKAIWNKQTNDDAEIAFQMTDGQIGDTVYIEQYQYVPGGSMTIICPSAFFAQDASASTSDILPFIEYTFVNADGTVDTSQEKTHTGVVAGAVHRVWLMTKQKEWAYLRLRYGYTIANNAFVATDKALGIMDWAWTNTPESYDVTLRFTRTGWSPTNGGGPWDIQMGDTDAPYGVSKWVAPSAGMLLAISVMTNDSITAGAMTFYAEVNGSKVSDPLATLTGAGGGGDTKATDTRDLTGVKVFDIQRLDQVDIRADETGAFSSSGTADYTGTLHLRMIFDDYEDSGSTGGLGAASA